MTSVRDDLRIRLTKELLRKSLLHLMEEKPIGELSVSDLCRSAGINRGTFYKHYATPWDLLTQIQDELFQKILTSVEKAVAGNALELVLEEIFRAIAENSDLCRVLLSENGDKDFMTRILRIAYESAMEDWKRRYKGGTKARYQLCYAFIANGSLGVIRDWIAEGFKRSPAEMAGFIGVMSAEGMRGILGGASS